VPIKNPESHQNPGISVFFRPEYLLDLFKFSLFLFVTMSFPYALRHEFFLSPKRSTLRIIKAQKNGEIRKCRSVKTLCKKNNISVGSLYRCKKAMAEGRKPGVNGRPKLITEEMESIIISKVEEAAKAKRCLKMCDLEKIIIEIGKKSNPRIWENKTTISRNTIKSFIQKSELSLQRPMGNYTIKSLPPRSCIRRFLSTLHAALHYRCYPKELIINMDESWLMVDEAEKRFKVVTVNEYKPFYKTGIPPCHITLFGCITASGGSLPSSYIVPSSKVTTQGLERNNLEYLTIFTQRNGWCNMDILEQWTTKILLPYITYIRGRIPRAPALLIVDAHTSRRSETFRKLLSENNVDLMILPSGTTSRFQPLDLNVFGRYKLELTKTYKGSGIYELLKVSEEAWNISSSYVHVKAGWDRSKLFQEDYEDILTVFPDSEEPRNNRIRSNQSGELVYSECARSQGVASI